MPFLATMPMTMIMPIRDATLNVVLVSSNARKPPNVNSNAEVKIAVGAEKDRNSNRSTANRSKRANSRTIIKSREDFRSSSYSPPYWMRMEEGRCMSRTAFCTAATPVPMSTPSKRAVTRSEEHTSELQSLTNLVCRLLLEKKKKKTTSKSHHENTDRRQTT